jgi:hypothetical protein
MSSPLGGPCCCTGVKLTVGATFGAIGPPGGPTAHQEITNHGIARMNVRRGRVQLCTGTN